MTANGRTLGDVKGGYTFTSPRGQSTVDYFIVSAEHLSSVADMKVMRDAQYCNLSCDVPHDGQKSDHFPLQLDLACTISINNTNASSSSAQPSTCPQFKYVESQADAYQQCLTAELLMHLVPLLSGTNDVDTVVASLITCITEAAQQTLPHKQKQSVQNTFPRNPWFDTECKAARKMKSRVYYSNASDSRKRDSCAMLPCCD